MLHQNPDVDISSSRQQSKPDLKEDQQVRILQGQYRGTVGRISGAEWDEAVSEWLYDVSDGRVYLGQYRSKELW